MMHATDWLPTLLNLIGEQKQLIKRKIDGFDMWKTFQDKVDSPRTEVLINIDPLLYKNAALRIGDWKIVNQSKFGPIGLLLLLYPLEISIVILNREGGGVTNLHPSVISAILAVHNFFN